VIDQEVCPNSPACFGDESHQVDFDLLGILLIGEPKQSRESPDMSIDDNALVDAKGIAQHDISGLSSYPWKVV